MNLLTIIANGIMSGKVNLSLTQPDLKDGGGVSGGGTTGGTGGAKPDTSVITDQVWFRNLISAIQKWITPLLVLACAAGAIWAIVLGVKMAQAEDKGKRDEAKQALVNVIIALVAVIALILIFTVVGNALLKNPIVSTAAD